jgi:hypothetical protein
MGRRDKVRFLERVFLSWPSRPPTAPYDGYRELKWPQRVTDYSVHQHQASYSEVDSSAEKDRAAKLFCALDTWQLRDPPLPSSRLKYLLTTKLICDLFMQHFLHDLLTFHLQNYCNSRIKIHIAKGSSSRRS